ncbi:helix-turn-helix domain-containing protein [Maritalea sp.]|uniref:helix-turn-helix domain-containing protein n=1 Tax=Maritalea sp. TaxID=2003361 RepID=UPI003EF37041
MTDLPERLAARLKLLRAEHALSLDQLAIKSGISRATLSRLEKFEVSPTAQVLGKLCAVYQLPMSRLLAMVEEEFEPYLPYESQKVWRDEANGFTRTSISPPATGLGAELVRCALEPGKRISYDQPSLSGLEHHLYMLEGELELLADGVTHHLKSGDCLRYQLFEASRFSTPEHSGAIYLLVLV